MKPILRVLASLSLFVFGMVTFALVQQAMLKSSISLDEDSRLRIAVPWLDTAKVYRCGRYLVFAPKDRLNASLLVVPRQENPYPAILIEDQHVNVDCVHGSRQASILVFDSAGKSLEIIDDRASGVFDSYKVSLGLMPEHFTYWDRTFSGYYQYRIADGGRAKEVNVGGVWRELLFTNSALFVNMPEGLRDLHELLNDADLGYPNEN